MIILGIDPGPTHCGVVLYSAPARLVLRAASAMSVADVRKMIRVPSQHVVIEQVMSQGQSGNDLLRTAEVCGRLYEAAMVGYEEGYADAPPVLMPRREVCAALGIAGKGKDPQVREAMIEIHGGSKAAACGTKKAPGPLYGVSGHAWQALGLVRGWMASEAIKAARAAGGAR